MTNRRYKRRSINLDDVSYNRCKEIADSMKVSVSAVLRLLIKEIYEQHEAHLAQEKRDADQARA
jgi:predicted DNA-binding ribbon-helix-helix protein